MWILVHICTSKVKVIFELAQLGADKIQQQSIYMYMHTYTENMFSRLYGAVTSKGLGGVARKRARAHLYTAAPCAMNFIAFCCYCCCCLDRGVGRKLVLVRRWFARGARPKFLRTLIIHEQSRTFYGAFYQLLSPAAHAKLH